MPALPRDSRDFTPSGYAPGVFRNRWDPFRCPKRGERRPPNEAVAARNLLQDNLLSRAGDGTRTHDVQLGKLAFYQLNYARETYHGQTMESAGRL